MNPTHDLLSDLFGVPQIIFTIGGAIAIVAIVFGTISGVVSRISVTRERERTRREIAAYVAEGSIDADKGIELLRAGVKGEDAQA